MEQFVLLVYQGSTPLPGTAEWDALPATEQAAIYADYAAINQTPGVSTVPPLGLPTAARTVRVRESAIETAAGPYLGDDGAVGGVLVFEADDLQAAIELAARVPAARHGGAVEVRPAAKYW